MNNNDRLLKHGINRKSEAGTLGLESVKSAGNIAATGKGKEVALKRKAERCVGEEC